MEVRFFLAGPILTRRSKMDNKDIIKMLEQIKSLFAKTKKDLKELNLIKEK
jgi:hypothetical protein